MALKYIFLTFCLISFAYRRQNILNAERVVLFVKPLALVCQFFRGDDNDPSDVLAVLSDAIDERSSVPLSFGWETITTLMGSLVRRYSILCLSFSLLVEKN